MTKNKNSSEQTKFKANTNYLIGVVPENSEKNDYVSYPTFSERPKKSWGGLGASLMSPPVSCKTFLDYLQKNPHQFPLHKKIACYSYDSNNQRWDYIAEGNPLSAGVPVNLADGSELSKQVSMPVNTDNNRNDKIVAQTLKDSIDDQRKQNADLQAQLFDWQKKYFDQLEINKKLEAENERLKVQNEEKDGLMDRYMKQEDEKPKPTLTDGINYALSNPAFQPVIAKIIDIGAAWFGKMVGTNPEPTPQTEAEMKLHQFQNGTPVPNDSLNQM